LESMIRSGGNLQKGHSLVIRYYISSEVRQHLFGDFITYLTLSNQKINA